MKIAEKIQHYGLEFITVFLGVTLSLVAENWRQHRADFAAEHDSMVQLYSNLGSEQGDMSSNMNRAQAGLRSARYLIAGVSGHSPDSVSAALTGLGQCSFFVPYQSEYTALKSSGRLSIIEEPTLREQIVQFYEVDPFVQWLHERDCTLTGELMDAMAGKLEFAEPLAGPARIPRDSARGPRDTLRSRDTTRLRDTARFRDTTRIARGPGDSVRPNRRVLTPEDSARRALGREFGQADGRYPRIVFHTGQDAVLAEPVLRDRIVRLASQRSYLITQLQGRITTAERLRDSLRVRLGSDTIPVQNGRGGGRRPTPLSGNTSTAGGTRRP